ncbi:hypothetical protein C0995_011671, partial [Termitomyces sp. Mi166
VLVGNPTSEVENTVKEPRPIRRLPGTIRPRSNPLPQIPDSTSQGFCGWKRKRVVETAEPVPSDGDHLSKKLRLIAAAQAVPAALLDASMSVVKASAAVLIGLTSAVVKTPFLATKRLVSAVRKFVRRTPPAKPPPEVIVIDDDD